MNALEIIAQDLFDKVRSRFANLQMGDETGAVTLEPKQARLFDFDFVLEGNNLGRVSISINEVGSLKVFYSQGILEGVDHISAGMWYDFLKEMRQFAKRRLLRFDTRDISKGNLDKNDFQYLAQNGTQENNMNEASYYGSSMSSYRKLEDTKLILRHSKAVAEDQPGARSRHISAIFIENSEGERFKYPYVHLAGAKAMQRHVANGGNPYDDAGRAIVGMSEAINQLGRFKRHYSNSENLTDDVNTIVTRAKTKLESLRTTVDRIGKQGHYEEWMESFSPSSLPEMDQVTMEEYKTKFTIQQFDETLTDVFPLLHAIMQETSELDLEQYVGEAKESDVCPECHEDPCVCDTVEEGTTADDKEPPFDPDPPKKNPVAKAGKYGQGYSTAKHLAKQGMKTAEKSPAESIETFEEWADEIEEGPNKSDVPAYLRKAKGEKPLTKQELDAEPEKNISHPKALRRNAGVGEGYYLGPEDLPDWTKEALQRVKDGQVRDWTELYAELTGDLGIDDTKAEHIAKRVFGYQGVNPALRKPAPDMDMKHGDDAEDDDNEFLAKMRARVQGGGTLKHDDFGAEVGEEMEQPKAGAREIAEVVKSMYDRETGKFPRGETGVVLHVKKEFGDQAAELAERLVQHLISRHESQQQMESMRRLAGLPPLTEAEKKTMSRAAKGVMKYGKDGMKALAKAGKEGKDLDKIRDKYNKYDESTGMSEESHQSATTMKHVKNPTKGEKQAAKDIKPGIAGYRDRIDMLQSAKKDGRLKNEASNPSAGLSKGQKSSIAKKARAGGDIGKPGKSFDKVAKAAGGGEKGKRIAAAAMWKNAAR